MMGEGLSFVLMVLQNLILDELLLEKHALEDGVEDTEYTLRVRTGGLTAVVGDDYLRLFVGPRFTDYEHEAFRLFSWRVSAGKHGGSLHSLQLAEEFGYIREPTGTRPYQKLAVKQDTVKIKYLAVPGPNASKDVPAWVGRAKALTSHMEWAVRDGHLSEGSARFLCDRFRAVAGHDSVRIPAVAALPPVMGGMLYPTRKSLKALLHLTCFDRNFAVVIAQGSGARSGTMARLSSLNVPHGTAKGVTPPHVEIIEEGLPDVTEDYSPGQSAPVTWITLARHYRNDPRIPKASQKWLNKVDGVLPSREQVAAVAEAEGMISLSSVKMATMRREVLVELMLREEYVRAALVVRFGSMAPRIKWIMRSVSNATPLTGDGYHLALEEWRTLVNSAEGSYSELSTILSFFLTELWIPLREWEDILPGDFPWSYRLQ